MRNLQQGRKLTSELGAISLTYAEDFHDKSISTNLTNTNPMGIFSLYLLSSNTASRRHSFCTASRFIGKYLVSCGTREQLALLCPPCQNDRFLCCRHTLTTGLTSHFEPIAAGFGVASKSTRTNRIMSNSSSREYHNSMQTFPMLGCVKLHPTSSYDFALARGHNLRDCGGVLACNSVPPLILFVIGLLW